MCVCSVANCTALLIQQNDWSGSMNRSWAEYKVGFGERSRHYWLGNDLLSQLTANYRYKLKIDLQSIVTGNWYVAKYSRFRVLPESYSYTLQAGGFSGNASYDALGDCSGLKFSTFDRDNDQRSSRNYAAMYGGGCWYEDSYYPKCLVNAAFSTGHFQWYRLPGGRGLQRSLMWLMC